MKMELGFFLRKKKHVSRYRSTEKEPLELHARVNSNNVTSLVANI